MGTWFIGTNAMGFAIALSVWGGEGGLGQPAWSECTGQLLGWLQFVKL
jgi:hypothetical protein